MTAAKIIFGMNMLGDWSAIRMTSPSMTRVTYGPNLNSSSTMLRGAFDEIMLDIPSANLLTVGNSQLFKLYRVLASHLKLSIALMPATIQGHASTPSICPIKCLQSRPFSIFCFFSSHMIHALLPSSWPPPYLFFSWCDSSKPRPMPRPSFADLPEGVHLTEPRPPFQGTIEVSNLDSFFYFRRVISDCRKPMNEMLGSEDHSPKNEVLGSENSVLEPST